MGTTTVPAPATAARPLPALPAGQLRRSLDRLYSAAGAAGCACIALIGLLMVAQSVGRQAGVPTGAINDVVAWLCAAAAFLTMADAFRNGDFVRVTLVLERLAPSRRRGLELACLGLAAVSLAYLAFWACRFTWQSWEFKEVAQGLWAVPIWIPQLSFAFGSVLFLVAVLDEWIVVLRGGTPSYTRRVQERHAQGDFSADL